MNVSAPYPPGGGLLACCPTLPSGPSSLESVDDSLVVAAAVAVGAIASPDGDQSCSAENMLVS